MANLRSGERVTDAFVVADSSYGRGCFYITNLGIIFESAGYGVVISLQFDAITRYAVANRKFRFDWLDGTKTAYYEVSVKFPKQVFLAYQKANSEYAARGTGHAVLHENNA